MTTIGQNSPATPVPEHGAAERRRQQAGVGEDRHERAERGRGQRDADQPALGVEPAGVQREADAQPERERDRPAARAARERAPRHVLLDHLEPGEEEEEHEPEVREEARCTGRPRAQPSTSGPIRIPSTISTTTVGSTSRWWTRDRIAPSADAASTRTSDCASSAAARRRAKRAARSCAGESMACRDRGRRDAGRCTRERPRQGRARAAGERHRRRARLQPVALP